MFIIKLYDRNKSGRREGGGCILVFKVGGCQENIFIKNSVINLKNILHFKNNLKDLKNKLLIM